MLQFKKRVRLLAERHGIELGYGNEGVLHLRTNSDTITFSPESQTDMSCTVTTAAKKFQFNTPKVFVFDIIQRFATGRLLDSYSPNGLPLTVQDYIDEEHAASTIAELQKSIAAGTAENGELGGNRFSAEYFNGILILFDTFTDAPTNVVDFSQQEFEG